MSGSDTFDGINEPYQTLQYALDKLRPGDVLVIEDSGQPYSSNAIIGEERDINGALIRTLRGYRVSINGTPTEPIIIEGRGTNKPVIDQQQSASTSTEATLGFLLDCVSNIVVRNLEIRSANEAGITTATNGACETSNIVIEQNHIHNIYGEKYVGGIRMMGVSEIVIRDNYIHDIFSNASLEQKALIKNGAGIQNIQIENNQLESLDTGIAINAQGLGSSTFGLDKEEPASIIQINDNTFDTVNNAINLTTSVSNSETTDEYKTGLFSNIDVVGNIFLSVDSALTVDAGSSQKQSQEVCVYNNTIVNTVASVMDISGVTDLEAFNNIFVGPQSEILLTRSTENMGLSNSIAYSDDNLFYDFSVFKLEPRCWGSKPVALSRFA